MANRELVKLKTQELTGSHCLVAYDENDKLIHSGGYTGKAHTRHIWFNGLPVTGISVEPDGTIILELGKIFSEVRRG